MLPELISLTSPAHVLVETQVVTNVRAFPCCEAELRTFWTHGVARKVLVSSCAVGQLTKMSGLKSNLFVFAELEHRFAQTEGRLRSGWRSFVRPVPRHRRV